MGKPELQCCLDCEFTRTTVSRSSSWEVPSACRLRSHCNPECFELGVVEMPSAHDVLGGEREQMPAWLLTADEFRPEDFFSSRVVYYPGSGTDGQAFELFCGTHSVHCVLHIDLYTSASDIQRELAPDHPHHLKGYSPCVQIVLAPADAAALLSLNPELCPDGQDPVVMSALWTVLERQQGFGDEHGPERIAFLHIQAEAVWVCRNVWGALDRRPFAVVVQDHGFGGGWTRFGGRESPLYQYQFQRRRSLPRWLIVAENTRKWPTYYPASDPTPPAGMGHHRRMLFRKRISGLGDRIGSAVVPTRG